MLMISAALFYNIWLGLGASLIFSLSLKLFSDKSFIKSTDHHQSLCTHELSFGRSRLTPLILGMVAGGFAYVLFLIMSRKSWVAEADDRYSADESILGLIFRGLSLLLIPGLNVSLTLSYVDHPAVCITAVAFALLSYQQIRAVHCELDDPGLIASPLSRLIVVMGTVIISIGSYCFLTTLVLHLLEARPEKDLVQLYIYVVTEYSYQLPETLKFNGTLRRNLIVAFTALNTLITYYFVLKTILETCLNWCKWRVSFFSKRFAQHHRIKIMRGAYDWARAMKKKKLAIKCLYELKNDLEFRQFDDFYKPVSTLLGELALEQNGDQALKYAIAAHEVQESYEHHSAMINEEMRQKSLKLYAITASELSESLHDDQKLRLAADVTERTKNLHIAIDLYHQSEINIVPYKVIKPEVPQDVYLDGVKHIYFLCAWAAQLLASIDWGDVQRSPKDLTVLHEGFQWFSDRSQEQDLINKEMSHFEIIYFSYMIVAARRFRSLDGRFIESLHKGLNQRLSSIFHEDDRSSHNKKTWQLWLGLALIASDQIHISAIEMTKTSDQYLIKAIRWLDESEYREFKTLISQALNDELQPISIDLEQHRLDQSGRAIVEKWFKYHARSL